MSIKKFSLIAVVLVLLALPLAGVHAAEAVPAQQDDDLPGRTITVTGFGYAYGAPDVVRVGLGVEAANADIMVAMNEVSTRMDAVIQVLTQAGVAPEDIRTDYFSVYQDYSFSGAVPESGEPAPVYRVSTSVTVTVRTTENVGELLASAISAGANRVDYMQFDISDRGTLEAEARDLAVADARERADQLAATLGLTVGEVVRVVENSDMFSPLPQFGGGGGGGDMGSAVPPISQGQLSVSMAVTITFAVGQ